MIPRRPSPEEFRHRCRSRAAHCADENRAYQATAAELAAMHPLLRALVGEITRDAVETTTVYNADGFVRSVKTKRKQRHLPLRSIQTMLTTARDVLELELEQALAAGRTGHNHNGHAGNGAKG
jgi:hypothetical protein